MIEELLHVAHSHKLTGHHAFIARRIPWLVEIDSKGQPLGLVHSVEEKTDDKPRQEEQGKGKGKEYKNAPVIYPMRVANGKVVSSGSNDYVPTPFIIKVSDLLHTFYAEDRIQDKWRGKPTFAAGQVLEKRFKEFLDFTFSSSRSEKLQSNADFSALLSFLQSSDGLNNLYARFRDIDSKFADEDKFDVFLISVAKDDVSFRVNRKFLFRNPDFVEWWKARYETQRNAVIAESPQGSDMYGGNELELAESSGQQSSNSRLAKYFPKIWSSVAFASFDRAPFESYGLGSQTTYLGVETAEKTVAALNWLLNDKNSCRMSVGGMDAIFWAKSKDSMAPVSFVSLLSSADPKQIKDFLKSVHRRQPSELDQDAKFNFALLKRGTGRFAVRSWHSENLREAEDRVRRYFEAIKLPPSKFSDDDVTRLSLAELAKATVRESPSSNTYVTLFEAALFGGQIANKLHKIFALVLERQKIEITVGVAAVKGKNLYQRVQTFEDRLNARTALIQLYFTLNHKSLFTEEDQPMSIERHKKSNDALASDAAYLCGRLLAMLDRIHIRAHNQSGGTNTSPANRAYRAASITPAFIFPQLLQTARYHLNKMENKGEAKNLQSGKFDESKQEKIYEGLNSICARLQEVAPSQGFPRLFNLDEQGRFALGFYYERHVLDNSGDGEANNTLTERQPEATIQYEGANQ